MKRQRRRGTIREKVVTYLQEHSNATLTEVRQHVGGSFSPAYYYAIRKQLQSDVRKRSPRAGAPTQNGDPPTGVESLPLAKTLFSLIETHGTDRVRQCLDDLVSACRR